MRRFFCFNFLGDFYQAVLLFSLRELDFPVNHVGSRKLSVFVADDFVVDFEARLFNQPPASPLLSTKPICKNASITLRPVASATVMLGRSSPATPCSKVLIAVS